MRDGGGMKGMRALGCRECLGVSKGWWPAVVDRLQAVPLARWQPSGLGVTPDLQVARAATIKETLDHSSHTGYTDLLTD